MQNTRIKTPMRIHSRRLSLLCLTLALTPLPAQDLTTTALRWISAEDPPDTLPDLNDPSLARFSVPPSMKAAKDPAYADFRVTVTPDGIPVAHSPAYSTALFDQLDWSNRRGRKAKPATRDGKPVASAVRFQIIFNPASAAPDKPDATPRLLDVVAPPWPGPILPRENPDPRVVQLQLRLDPAGNVESAQAAPGTPPDFAQQAERTVRRWQFAPARQAGAPVAADLTVPMIFTPDAPTDVAELTTLPKPTRRVPPEYPMGMRQAGFEGEVTVGFVVTAEGRVNDAYVVRSTHSGFDEAAVDAVMEWRFEPGKINGRVVNTRMQVPIIFAIQGGGTSPWRIKKPRKFPDTLPLAMQWDQPPELRGYMPPVYPREALAEGRRGTVQVRFLIDPRGRVLETVAQGVEDVALRAAAVAAVETFSFTPASREGEACYAMIGMEFKFEPSGRGDAEVTSAMRRLLRTMENTPSKLTPLSDLDASPRPLSRRPPTTPLAAIKAREEGEALIEFIIDQRGFARLPRVVNATRPEFGYAAAQAIATWRFEAPRRDGKPVDAIVRIPMKFSLQD